MTDTLDHVVIPYSSFLEWRDKRRKPADAAPPRPPTTDADLPPVPNHPPAPMATARRTP